jgi:hypothetical protein
MDNTRNLRAVRTTLALLAIWGFAIGCSSTPEKPAASPTLTPTAQFTVYVNFNGPWAFMPDPADATQIIAVAPYIKDHQNAYVAALTDAPLPAGVFKLTGLPPSSTPMNLNSQLIVVQDTISATALKKIEGNSNKARYFIRLPMPAEISAYRTGHEAVGNSYPVLNAHSNEKGYATHMTLRYNSDDVSQLKVTGTKDDLTTVNVPLQLGLAQTIDIGVGPTYDLQEDDCHNHAKGAFKALADLFQVKQIIDYPDYDLTKCGGSDPQNPHPTPGPVPHAGGRAGADCKAAMMVFTVTP